MDDGNYKEIDDRGLQLNEITSVKQLGGYVYATTLSGLFYKPASRFFTYLPQAAAKSFSLKLLSGHASILK